MKGAARSQTPRLRETTRLATRRAELFCFCFHAEETKLQENEEKGSGDPQQEHSHNLTPAGNEGPEGLNPELLVGGTEPTVVATPT